MSIPLHVMLPERLSLSDTAKNKENLAKLGRSGHKIVYGLVPDGELAAGGVAAFGPRM
jgi:hypothetical protein